MKMETSWWKTGKNKNRQRNFANDEFAMIETQILRNM